MKFFLKKQLVALSLLFFLSLPPGPGLRPGLGLTLSAQDLDARSPKPNAGSAQQKKADKKKAKQIKQSEKAVKKGIKRHKKIQAKKTKKMMKKSKHSSEMWNSNKREPFYKRMFKKKQR